MPDPIRHVVLLMLENHSFDQMLGCFKQPFPSLEGVDPAASGTNADGKGIVFSQQPTTARSVSLDPRHEVVHVKAQLADNNGGFVQDFEKCYPGRVTEEQKKYIMGYYPMDSLPSLHALAQNFTICDHWYASVPGPTWPNRFFALSGTSSGCVDMPDDGEHRLDLKGYMEQDQQTIFDRLGEQSISWKIYFSGPPQSIVFRRQRRLENISRYFTMDRFFKDAAGPEADFPQFCLIEPDFMGVDENDDHPPHDVMNAQKLIADVYNAISANSELWNSTLLVVLYDEHGGFYDHVSPPAAIPPDEHADYPFNRLGVRVPAVLVSPWIPDSVVSQVFDHTSLLKYLIEKWGLGQLGKRTDAAQSIGQLIRAGSPPRKAIPPISIPERLMPSTAEKRAAAAWRSGHHAALGLLMKALKEEALDDGAPMILRWWRKLLQIRDELLVMAGRKDCSDIVRDDFAFYHARQIARAEVELAAMINDDARGLAIRRHAAVSLGYLKGVPFGSSADPVLAAKAWLEKNHE